MAIQKRKATMKPCVNSGLKRKLSDAAVEIESPVLKMIVGSHYLPKENKKHPLGEDAYFVCEEMQTIGVADGVGGWAKSGIDAGEYARQLMFNSRLALKFETKGAVNPRRVLQEGYEETTADGSSTACIITLNGDSLFFANVGDSGFMVFRENRCVYHSPTQQSRFNCPHQLSVKRGGIDLAYEGEFKVEHGDVVVAGTDGLLDNLYPAEIEEIMSGIEGSYWPEQLAWSIAAMAYANSVDEEYDSPFASAAALAGQDFSGGKYDDITVVVAQIEDPDFKRYKEYFLVD